MTRPCRDFEVLLSLRAAGALDRSELVRVEGHLAGCAACRAEADDVAAALDLATLPPVADAERRALAGLPDRALAALRRGARVRALWRRAALGVAAAAAAAALVVVPVLHRRATDAARVETAAAWELDVDAVWNDSGLVDLEAAADAASAASAGVAYAGVAYAGEGEDSWDADAALAVDF